MKAVQKFALLSAACALAGLNAVAHAAFVTIPVATGSTTTLTACNPKAGAYPNQTQSPTLTTCKVTGLPGSAGIPGYVLKSSTSSSIVFGSAGTNVGTLYDRVWCKGTGTTCDSSNTYILGARINLNGNASFTINDFFRTVRSGTSVDIGYYMPPGGSPLTADNAQAIDYLEYSGRTLQGMSESPGSGNTKTTNNNWIDFRVEIGANEWSPWLLVRQVCPSGYNATPQSLKGRLLGGIPPAAEILKAVYVCN